MIHAQEFSEEEEVQNSEEATSTLPEGRTEQGFHSFAPKVSGVLFKISPLTEEICSEVEKYMKEGYMKRDLAFVDTLYGLVAPSQRKEFSLFWESPWVEEQINDAAKKRKIEQQQRTMAVRSFIKAKSTQESSAGENEVDNFLSTVNRLTEWDYTGEDRKNGREAIKTVSRMVQSFEKKAVLNLLSLLESGTIQNPAALHHLNRLKQGAGDVDPITHALRRAPYTYVAFAALVAAELLLSEGTNGSRNTTINMSRRMDMEKFNAVNTMLDKLQKATAALLPRDTVGLPLMQTTYNVCISRGVLVVSGKSTKATYVLDIDNLDEVIAGASSRRKKGVIQITAQIFDDETALEEKGSSSQPPKKKTQQQRSKSQKNKQPSTLASLV